MRRLLALVSTAVLALPLLAQTALAQTFPGDGSWLDGPLTSWNVPGAALPAPPSADALPLGGLAPDDPFFARCDNAAPQSAEEPAVAAAGWILSGQNGRFAPVDAAPTIVWGTAGYDGMCRPWGYQGFAFADGIFIGTISPELMYARGDGSATNLQTNTDGMMTVTYERYLQTDPRCCPSQPPIEVTFEVSQRKAGLVLMPIDRRPVMRGSADG